MDREQFNLLILQIVDCVINESSAQNHEDVKRVYQRDRHEATTRLLAEHTRLTAEISRLKALAEAYIIADDKWHHHRRDDQRTHTCRVSTTSLNLREDCFTVAMDRDEAKSKLIEAALEPNGGKRNG